MKKTAGLIHVSFLCILCALFLCCHTVRLKYEPASPRIYFHDNKIWVETDTASLLKQVRKNYSPERANQIASELDYRIGHSRNDSILMDGRNLRLYLNENRTSYEGGVLNHDELRHLLKTGTVKIYDINSKRMIGNLSVKKVGSRRKNNIDEVYYDKETGQEIIRVRIYTKQY